MAFPGYDVWWLAIVGCAALALATAGARWWAGGLAGLLLGLAWFTPMFTWAGTYAGTAPWLAMSIASACYPAALGSVLALLQRHGAVRPVTGAAAWVLVEWARSVTPFGGFPWARLGFSQADSPLLGAVSIVAVAGLGFLVALCGGLLAVTAQRLLQPGRTDRRRACGVLLVAAVLVLAPTLVPRPTQGEPISVAAVQADLPEGFSRTLSAEPGTILARYTDRTQDLAERVTRGQATAPELVLWPEGATDLDPLDPRSGQDTTARIMQAVDAIGAPVVLGGISRKGGEPAPSNMVFGYLPGQGLADVYAKIYLAPFGEVMPMRPLMRHLSPWVDRITDLAPGREPGVMSLPLPESGDVVLGLAICFEVLFDPAMRDLVSGGAELLVVPTSNAWFGEGDQAAQHIAVSRVRALEYGRSVVHISNVGVSGLITPDGTVHDRTRLYTEATLEGVLPLRTDQTLALRTGPWLVPAAALIVLVGALRTARSVARRMPSSRP
ncbi:apolipoprotein N-acyltransferase [Serinicoccus hydrothermalis]|uniref:apolipoprotein N-acyltransferase n=1 Tax=Serinicoccus hydrothermalis TaxID=1758689 RepID=UPI001F02FD90|nr:apolipoprotein N-acyltransferase [Serinicoccus hydrothermalis]